MALRPTRHDRAYLKVRSGISNPTINDPRVQVQRTPKCYISEGEYDVETSARTKLKAQTRTRANAGDQHPVLSHTGVEVTGSPDNM